MSRPNSTRGKLIIIEGPDGSGKHTQVALLTSWLKKHGIRVFSYHFPQYETFMGSYVGKMLRGEFGNLADLNPYLIAPMYALDRFGAKGAINEKLAAGWWGVFDRYVWSNSHQAAKAKSKKEMLQILRYFEILEYKILGLPKEDAVVYLRVDPLLAKDLIKGKPRRRYLGARKPDIAESDLSHQLATAGVYDYLSETQPNWIRVDCMQGEEKVVKSKEHIHKAVLSALQAQGVLKLLHGSSKK